MLEQVKSCECPICYDNFETTHGKPEDFGVFLCPYARKQIRSLGFKVADYSGRIFFSERCNHTFHEDCMRRY